MAHVKLFLKMDMFLVIVVVFCISLSIHHLLKNRRRLKTLLGSDIRTRRVLFIIAHPDDECMFFAPTILSLTNSNQYEVFLLCLSSGNYNQLGRVREKELVLSCKVLGMRENHVFLVNHCDIQDDPHVVWDKKLLMEVVLPYVRDYYIDLIFTFDEHGVSGHSNHRALFYAVQCMLSTCDSYKGLEVYKLVTTGLLRKYLSIVDICFTYLTSGLMFVSRWRDVWRTQAAMWCHHSQLTWFRVLYIIFSRYVIINSYDRVQPLQTPTTNGGNH